MVCCLNPDCAQPINSDQSQFCQHCGVPLMALLRNRFKVLKPLGRGGFGKTYLAEDAEKLNESCVVKQLAYRGYGSDATLQKVRELFEREARQLQTLGQHPQIPTLLAYFEEQSYLYLVQQYINGPTLQNELEHHGPFNDGQIRQVLLDLLPILDFIHKEGIVHRDLKPENIIRSQVTQKLVLIDFGVSKVLSTSVQSSAVQSNPGTMLGSQGYSPIEQLLEGKASPASDLFSLGATCFHLLSNIPPLQLWANSGYQWTQNWQQYLPAGFSQQTVTILNHLLQSDVQQRYQNCEQVLQDLQPSQPPAVTQPNPPTIPQEAVHTSSPNAAKHPNPTKLPKAAIAGGVAIAFLIGAPMVWTLTQPQAAIQDETNTEQTNQEITKPSNELAQIELKSLPSPNFQRAAQAPDNNAPEVNQISATPNLITDTSTWFKKHQLSLPTYTVPNPVRNENGNIPEGVEDFINGDRLVKAIQSQDTLLLFYGPDYSGGTSIYGYDETTSKYLYGLDLQNYMFAPENDPADIDFVDQRVKWAEQEGNILYISHGHNTYARSSRGMNAYLTAIDLTTQKALWTSQPLVSNAGNFLVLDEYIISGYGFTAEPDALFLIRKDTGAVARKIPLDTAPEFIFRKGDRLLVRGYNVDYEFARVKRRRTQP